MPNFLHTFLLDGFTQAQDYLGESFTLAGVTTTGFFSQASQELSMELTGFMDECDLMCVAKVTAFATKPPENSTLTYGGATYKLRGIKTDQSAYVFGFKKNSV